MNLSDTGSAITGNTATNKRAKTRMITGQEMRAAQPRKGICEVALQTKPQAGLDTLAAGVLAHARE